jgi:putative nucleotidyltransferase with HDIG domain
MPPPEKSVLIVDHDPVDRRAAKEILEHAVNGYVCDEAITRRQAAECLTKRTYDLILMDTDIEEPLDGVRLIQLILMRTGSNSKASTPLIIFAADRPDRMLVQKIVALGITDLIAKPYSAHVLLERIERALQAKREMEETTFATHLTTTLKQVTHIPTLSAVFAKVQAVLSEPEPSVEEVSRLIESDPAITLCVLHLANSAYFGFRQTVKTVKQAVTLTGFQTTRKAVLTASTFEALGKGTASAGLDRVGLWEHAIGCAEIAALLALAQQHSLMYHDVFTVGLLHDVGKIVLDTFFTEYYTPVMEAVRSQGKALVEAEQDILGLNHAEVGMRLVSMWDLPPELATIIGYHHRPLLAPEPIRPMAALVSVADALCRRIGLGNAGDTLVPPIDPEILDLLGFRTETLDTYLPDMEEAAKKAVTFLTSM